MTRVLRLLTAAMLLGLLGTLVRVTVATGDGAFGWLSFWAYNSTQLLAVAVCGLRATRVPRGERPAWLALTAGLGAYAAGDLLWTLAYSGAADPPIPSLADVGYLALFPATYVALVLLLRARAGSIPRPLWLDAGIAGLGVAAVGTALASSALRATDGSAATVVTTLAYPVGDLALLGFVAGVLAVTGGRLGRGWLLLATGLIVFAVTDTIYLRQVAAGTYVEDGLLDLGWPIAFALIALAPGRAARALSVRRLRHPGMLALPAAAALASVGLLVADHYADFPALAIWLAGGALLLAVVRFGLTFAENVRMLGRSEREATTDALTGLGNRRALLADLQRATDRSERHVLALFDLDGFKTYNDTFGHPAGDALLQRLGAALSSTLEGRGRAYRMGGDEFCLLAEVTAGGEPALVDDAVAALSEEGPRFRIGASHGIVAIEPGMEPAEALRIADHRMYADKRSGRRSTEEAVQEVLLTVLGEHDGVLRAHVDDVARLAERTATALGLDGPDLVHVGQAAALHDVGKLAIPDEVLNAPRPLEPDEWAYMCRHTIIGQRIISATPALEPVGLIVRASHERWDGDGYPDGLAGDAIPLGARIVAVCGAFDAMTTDRPYRTARTSQEALAELRRCSGVQFDPAVVDAFARAVTHQPTLARPGRAVAG